MPSSEGREFVGCFACFSFSDRVKKDLIFEALLFSFPFWEEELCSEARALQNLLGKREAPKQPRAPQLRVILSAKLVAASQSCARWEDTEEAL